MVSVNGETIFNPLGDSGLLAQPRQRVPLRRTLRERLRADDRYRDPFGEAALDAIRLQGDLRLHELCDRFLLLLMDADTVQLQLGIGQDLRDR